jgi:probable HAF family extracellular repeat protein
MRIARLALALALSLPLLAHTPETSRGAIAVAYTVTDLGTFGLATFPEDINEAGQVVGWGTSPLPPAPATGQGVAPLWREGATRDPDQGGAFLWQDGVMRGLGLGAAYAINEAGQVAGLGLNGAVLWRDGETTDLDGLGGTGAVVTAINDAGMAVGSSSFPPPAEGSRPVLWQGRTPTALALPPGADSAAAMGINNLGQVVGVATIPPDRYLAYADVVVWQHGEPVRLGFQASLSLVINDRGQIAGTRQIRGDVLRAFLYQAGQATDLGALGGQRSGTGGLNDLGHVVGSAETAAGDSHAFLYRDGAMADLNSLIPVGSGWVLGSASAINNLGQIVGTGMLHGEQRAFLLTPITSPLPRATPLPPGTAPRCFAGTVVCMRGLFADYWVAHGGLAVNGYPISGEFTEVLEDGQPYTVQYFERVRMEYHPENGGPYQVLLGQFGRRIHGGADPPVAAQSGSTYFEQTGHNVGPRFLAYWNANGGLAQFGFPITEEFTETLEDGQPYLVQYFERARFEYHPENQPPYDVLLGQFGRAILGER